MMGFTEPINLPSDCRAELSGSVFNGLFSNVRQSFDLGLGGIDGGLGSGIHFSDDRVSGGFD
jgi:hypothetical protein